MTHSDMVSMLEKKYGAEPVQCPNEGKPVTLNLSKRTVSDHGNLAVHSSGAFLVCGVCGFQLPVGT